MNSRINNNKKKFAYNLSEIVLSKDIGETLDKKLLKIDESIEKIIKQMNNLKKFLILRL